MYNHTTVLLEEAQSALCWDLNEQYIDATFGRGGHSRKILSSLTHQGRLVGVDQDPEAVQSGLILEKEDTRFTMKKAAFSSLSTLFSPVSIAGLLLDLGVSSPQLDNPDRGFSFMHDGPLDMRMNPDIGISAAEWLTTVSEAMIAQVLWEYGEESFSRRIAKAIVRERAVNPIQTTHHFAQVVKQAHPKWNHKTHPATRTFQAVRLFINQELSELKNALDSALVILKPRGRLVVISFHSLEDRIVKQFMKQHSLQYAETQLPREIPIQPQPLKPTLKRIGRPIKPSALEINQNTRARSAIMRIAEKC
ncbi:MAG: 16S rRNA (cytosine(1402)-N(4))-methyltransferase RsmH [Endozoicomonadaceae bacterium]|nr:16S rRNA (cytosine(1402)-N(4))-methyltransferase RsmH [Endozoicomonadaceae bacterium]